MKANASVRAVVIAVAATLGMLLFCTNGLAQDVGGDVGGGAGIFRPKNPETKKRSSKPMTPVTKTGTKATAKKPVTATGGDDRAEELLDRGNEFRDARKFAEAEGAYNGVLQIHARDARAAYGLGNVYTDQQRWADAEAAYRNAVLWNPADVDALVALSVVLVQPRTDGANAKRFADAETFARRAVQLQANNAVAWDRLGVALQSRGLFNAETEHAYRRAVELDPQFAVAYVHLARVLKRMGRKDEAEPFYERAGTLAKEPATLNLIAESLQEEQQWENSEAVLRRALQMDARNPESLYLLGRMLVVMKRYTEAEPYLQSAIEVSPRAFQPYVVLGSVYLSLNRYSDAEKTYLRAIDLAPAGDRKRLGGAFGFEGVADGYMKNNQRSDAARAYQQALALDPNNQVIEEKLSRARSH